MLLSLAVEPQFAFICIHSAKQIFVLQTQPAEPALDLYFSVCVWTPRPHGWKLMSSPSPGIQSERGNYTAIWSSSELQSQQIIPPAAAPACLTQSLSSNVMTPKTSCTDCLHCPAPTHPLQSGSEWHAHDSVCISAIPHEHPVPYSFKPAAHLPPSLTSRCKAPVEVSSPRGQQGGDGSECTAGALSDSSQPQNPPYMLGIRDGAFTSFWSE